MAKEKINLNISGMTCVNCSNGIERVVGRMKGVEDIQVSFASSKGEFLLDTEQTPKQKLIDKIKKLGYGVAEDLNVLETQKKQAFQKLKQHLILSALLTLILGFFALFPLESIQTNTYLMFFLASLVQFIAGARFYTLSFKALKNRNYDMNVLVAIGTSAAYFYSAFVVLLPDIFPENMRFLYFDGAAVIITFVLLGRFLEERSKAKATNFLKELMQLSPATALVEKGDASTEEVPVGNLSIGDIVIIKAGEKISTDAIIIEGGAEIDTSMITGESLPVYKSVGEEVIAGTLNTTGFLKVKVQKSANNTLLAQIITLLNDAQNKKMPIARFADKVANIFVPAVIIISIVTFILWYFFAGNALVATLASISVLIISCPCALGLATPIAIVSAVSKGAKEGILIKNPAILEQIKAISYAVFDKTGTLTQGNISVREAFFESKEHLRLVGALERQSEHPISKAIVAYTKHLKLEATVRDLEIIAGSGIKAYVNEQRILVGTQAFLESEGVFINEEYFGFVNTAQKEGLGAVFAATNHECVGAFSLEDAIKEEARVVISELKSMGITPILLTGDHAYTAKVVAKKLGIEQVHAQVLPHEKFEVVQELQKEAKVMFIGDGINDSPSLKQADIGVALSSGADIAKDAGDIILINNNLRSVLQSIRLSKASLITIKQNLFWAFIYNTLGIPLAAGVLYPFFGVLLSPMYAGIAMSFSSVTVVLNSLRLKLKQI